MLNTFIEDFSLQDLVFVFKDCGALGCVFSIIMKCLMALNSLGKVNLGGRGAGIKVIKEQKFARFLQQDPGWTFTE